MRYAVIIKDTVVDIVETSNVKQLLANIPADSYVKEVNAPCKIGDKVSYNAKTGAVIFTSPTLEQAREEKLARVNEATAKKIVGGFTSSCTGSPVRYDSDEKTQITMQGIALNADNIPKYYPNGIPVRGYEHGNDYKTILMLNGEQLLAWMADLSLHIGLCKQQGWALQEKVKQANSLEELEKVVI